MAVASWARRGSRDERGQTMVEIAVVLPVFVLVIFGVFDVGRGVYTAATLSQAAREGARLAATEAGWVGLSGDGCVASASAIGSGNPGAHVCPADLATLRSNVTTAVNRMAASVGPLSAVHISCNAGVGADLAPTGDWTEGSGGNGCDDGAGTSIGASGDLVSVRVELTYQPITPLIDSLLGPLELSGSASMLIN